MLARRGSVLRVASSWCWSTLGPAASIAATSTSTTAAIASEASTAPTTAAASRFAVAAGRGSAGGLVSSSALWATSLVWSTAAAAPVASTAEIATSTSRLVDIESDALVLLQGLLGRAVLQNLLHDFWRREVDRPSALLRVVHPLDLLGVFGAEQLLLDFFLSVQWSIRDENAPRWLLLLWRVHVGLLLLNGRLRLRRLCSRSSVSLRGILWCRRRTVRSER